MKGKFTQTRRTSRRGLTAIVKLESEHDCQASQSGQSAETSVTKDSSAASPESEPDLLKPSYPRVPLRSWLLLCVLALTEFGTFACITVLSPFFPQEAERKGSSGSTFGAIMGAFELAALVVSIVCIKVVLHVSPRKVLLIGVAFLGLGTISFCYVLHLPSGLPFIAVCTCLRLVQGLGAGMIDVCSYMVVSYKIPERVSFSIGVLEMSVGLGITAGPAVGGILYDLGGFGLPFIVLGVLILLTLPGNFFLFPEAERKSAVSGSGLVSFLMNRDVLIGILSITAGGMTLGFLTSELEPRLRQYHLSTTMVGLITVLPGAVFALMTPAFGHLADQLLNKLYLLLILSTMVSSVGYIFLGPVPGLNLEKTLWLLLVSLLICGLGAAAQSICPFALMLTSTRKLGVLDELAASALVSAVHITCSTAGTSLGPIIGGVFLDFPGFSWFCFMMTMFGVVQIGIYTLIWYLAKSRYRSSCCH